MIILVLYKGSRNHITIKCNDCVSSIKMTPDNHVRGEGFKISEKEIINYLEKQKYVLNSDLDLSFDSKLINLIKGNKYARSS